MRFASFLAVRLVLVAGCGKTRETQAEIDQRDYERRLAARVEHAKTHPPEASPCAVDAQLEKLLAHERVQDCGSLTPASRPAETSAAEACALGDASQQKPFRLVVKRRGTDSTIIDAFVGVGRPDTFQLYSVAYDGCPMGCGNGDPHAKVYRCAELGSAPSRSPTCVRPELVESCP